MTRARLYNSIAAALTLAVIFVLAMVCTFGLKPLPEAAETPDIVGTDGRPISAVCISDIGEYAAIKNVNYTPNEYLVPQNDIRGEIISLESDTQFAEKGTYEFVILNLSPSDEAFSQKSEALSPYLQGDNNWHVTLYLPACFSACNVYVKTNLNARVGDIADYQFVKYTASNYTEETVYHKNATEPLLIDLAFYTRRAAMSEDLSIRAAVVTVHYESAGGMAGFYRAPIIGQDSAVRKLVDSENILSFTVCVIAALFLATLVFACLLKRSLLLFPYILANAGAFLFFASYYALLGLSAAPMFWVAIHLFSLHWIAGASVCGLRVKAGKFPLWIVPAVLSAINCTLALLTPYFIEFTALKISLQISDAILAAMLCALVVIFIRRSSVFKPFAVVPTVISVGLLAADLFLSPSLQLIANPVGWICIVLIALTAGYSVAFFVQLERRNAYLTDNLQLEVERQTESLKDIISTNETLLRYLSHDMRKPVHGIQRFLSVLKESETDGEKLKAIGIIEQKTRLIDESLTELQQYSKQHYPVEPSKTFDAGNLAADICETLSPDCEANNIKLSCHTAHVKIYAKFNTLRSVLNNLIFNALEHSECSEIVLTVSRRKGICSITVTDNGVGIDPESDVFSPYVSGSDSAENLGLGLYISRESVLSMGGNLTYESALGKTSFTVTFPAL